jgi:hypothetical protein
VGRLKVAEVGDPPSPFRLVLLALTIPLPASSEIMPIVLIFNSLLPPLRSEILNFPWLFPQIPVGWEKLVDVAGPIASVEPTAPVPATTIIATG